MSKLTKSKTFKIGLVGSIIGLGVFGLTVGLIAAWQNTDQSIRGKL
ncbi:hypothetical protein CIB43_00357 [Mesomycoplasma hyopneumoniae]|uniref:Uncharacterized protein n=1 Tax=Mesomycoplasma hyopneumoniae TaxID=2099 RepID=A0A223M9L8_MESHO|nr:hypothetical protein CIB43_00357 [Mesomycoplasma hyopneumoniae]